jgi:hypothetical protein
MPPGDPHSAGGNNLTVGRWADSPAEMQRGPEGMAAEEEAKG